MDDERDILVFTDDDGQEIEMEVIDYFEFEGEEYAMLVEADDMEHDHDHEHGEDCCHGEEKDIYIMKVIVDGDTEEFIPVEDSKMDDIIAYIQDMCDEEEYDEEDFEDDEE